MDPNTASANARGSTANVHPRAQKRLWTGCTSARLDEVHVSMAGPSTNKHPSVTENCDEN
jgi:hypothetical protein